MVGLIVIRIVSASAYHFLCQQQKHRPRRQDGHVIGRGCMEAIGGMPESAYSMAWIEKFMVFIGMI